jgi:hypothetical protein
MSIDKTLLDKIAAALLERTEDSFDIAEAQHKAVDTRHGSESQRFSDPDGQRADADP